MAMEELGRRKNSSSHHGFGYRHLFGGGEKAEEKTSSRLLVGKLDVPQLVGVSILFLRNSCTLQCNWLVIYLYLIL